MAIDRNAWIFGLAVAAIAVLFSLTSPAKQESIAAYFLGVRPVIPTFNS